jgi:hypothetical protein
MKNKVIIEVTEEQYHIIVNALNELRNRCINENIDSIDVDYLLLDIINNKNIKEKVNDRGDNNAR